jgi:hypothetical protein
MITNNKIKYNLPYVLLITYIVFYMRMIYIYLKSDIFYKNISIDRFKKIEQIKQIIQNNYILYSFHINIVFYIFENN